VHVHFGVELVVPEWPQSVCCIGTFDGVHLGHRQVIGAAVAQARERGLPCILVTFDRHPAAVLNPERCPPAIASLHENLAHFASLGVAIAVVLPFDLQLSQTSAEDFYREVLVGKLRASALVVGHDFAFQERIETRVVPAFEFEGLRVSSSQIRKDIQEGRMEHACELLGRPFQIDGIVVQGEQLGRELGYPTANIARPFAQVLPRDGIYAGTCDTPLGEFRAATSIGRRPTVGGGERTIEAYLLDYPGDSLYGAAVSLHLKHRLRDELHFDSLDSLVEQMDRDVEQVRALLAD